MTVTTPSYDVAHTTAPADDADVVAGAVVEQAGVDGGDADAGTAEVRPRHVAIVLHLVELGAEGVDVLAAHVPRDAEGGVRVRDDGEAESAPDVVDRGAEADAGLVDVDVVRRPLVPPPDQGVGGDVAGHVGIGL